MTDEIQQGLPFEEKITLEGWRFVSEEEYLKEHEKTLDDDFWLEEAKKIKWFSEPRKVKEGKVPFVKWFPDGVLNISYLCVDENLKRFPNKVAIFWEGEDGKKEAYTYYLLARRVNQLSKALLRLGLKKGDKVAICMPMVPELPAVMLALARIGVTFTVVFSGFSANALAERIKDSESRILITADGYFRRGKKIFLQDKIREAVEKAPVEKIVVFRRLGEGWTKDKNDIFEEELLDGIPPSVWVEPEPLASDHPLFILYTSGTTGKPKGILRDTGGYAVFLNSTVRWVFDIRPADVFWCTADIGWITGHSYIVFGPLMVGATQVMYEGVPDWPDAGIWWKIVERYGVTVFYTSPTAVRMLMRFPDQYVKKYDLSTLRILHSVGEPINPEAWWWFFDKVGKRRCPVSSTWWMTETGGVMVSHTPGWLLVPLKPGTNGFPVPGVSVDVVDDKGNSVQEGQRGYLVIKKPWPGMLLGIWGDEERYVKTYWSKFEGMFWTGDWAVRDKDGYIWVLGRADEVMNVAGHRIGTYEIESALVGFEGVSESAVVSIPDPVKGEVPVAFVVLKEGVVPSDELKRKLKDAVKKEIGPIAVPKDIIFVAKLPKTRSGKIMRRVLKAVFLGKKVGDLSTLEDEASFEEVKKAYEEFRKQISK